MGDIRTPTRIYHITHVKNLLPIIASGGLQSCQMLKDQQTIYTNIAHQGIQDRRTIREVPCGKKGTLHNYVPFYFAPRSPMLYAILKGRVEGFQGGQSPIIYLSSTVQAIQQHGIPFVFTDGHGTNTPLTNFYIDLGDLDKLDWDVMNAKYWQDKLTDGDRKRRRQAEFLVHRFFPLHLVDEIGVFSELTKTSVEQSVLRSGHQLVVNIRKDWYY